MNASIKSVVPIIDLQSLFFSNGESTDVLAQIRSACVDHGFFYVCNHGVSKDLQEQLEALSQQFFSLPTAEKMRIRMALGGRAWRGYFPVGDELTSGRPDLKEGVYFGAEHDESNPWVQKETPLHGRNLFPAEIPEWRSVIEQYMEAMTTLGHVIMRGIAGSLGLPLDFFRKNYMSDPLTLFRVFHYPPLSHNVAEETWGVGEHTDYGLLTILKQDHVGGLQIKTRTGWIDAPFVPDTFICNIGDMLDRMTRGLYCSTPHRVKNRSRQSRYSYPFFFDPNFDARIKPLPIDRVNDTFGHRWDELDIHAFEGTYGDYILSKVSRVFPDLLSGQKK